MSAITRASGGDGWSTWETTRKGDEWHIVVYASTVTERQDTPAGWGPKVLHDETMRDDIGRRAVDRAISLSAEYARRMYS